MSESSERRTAEPRDKANVARRRELEKELMVRGFSAKDMVPVLRREGLFPSSVPDPADPEYAEKKARQEEGDYRLVRKDIAAITTQLANMAEDAHLVTKASRRIYRMRLERALRDAAGIYASDLNPAPLRATGLKTFVETSRLLAAVDGVATEAKVPVELGADAKLRALMEKMVQKRREREQSGEADDEQEYEEGQEGE